MEHVLAGWIATIDSAVRHWWTRRGVLILRCSVALMSLIALFWLGYEFWRLLWEQGRWGAIDLKTYHKLIGGWFAGRPIYVEVKTAVHPPATYVILWPFLGWPSVAQARWLWAATAVAALGWLVCWIVRQSKAETPLERAFVSLMPLSMYATGAAIGNGQVITHILPALVAGLGLLYFERSGWRNDVLVALLFLFTLVKPSISFPFFWIVLFSAGSMRPAALVALGYAGLTLFAASFQHSSLLTTLHNWLINPALGQPGETNLRAWLVNLGLEQWSLPASMLVLATLGFWAYCHRRTDLWLLLGVTALVSRMWMYHRWYDDLLILLPMVALFRMTKAGPSDHSDIIAGALLGVTTLAMLAPGGLYLFPPPWNMLYTSGQTIVWIILLIFLLDQARRNKRNNRLIDSEITS
jgi:hypothetical protein